MITKKYGNVKVMPNIRAQVRLQRSLNQFLFFLFIFSSPLLFQKETFGQDINDAPTSQVIVFDGLITDSNGEIFEDGTYTIIFSLYEKEIEGQALWNEVHSDVKLVNGIVNLELGKDIRNPIDVPFDKEYFIGIQLGEKILEPRHRFTAVPYSFLTKIATEVPDGSITTEKIADNSITDDKVESLDWNKITGTSNIDFTTHSADILPNFWRRHGNYLATGDEFLGTINDRNLLIRVDSVQRMIFEPFGRVVIGTLQDSVQFEVIGLTTLCDAFFRGKVGVGVYPGAAQLHIDSPALMTPFRVDSAGTEVFKIETNGRVTITSTQEGEEDDIAHYPLYIEGEDHGIAIHLHNIAEQALPGAIPFTPSLPGFPSQPGIPGIPGQANSGNNYISFWDTYSGFSLTDNMTGRIEGQSALDYVSDAKNIAHFAVVVAKVTAEAVAIAVTAASAAATAGVKWNEAEDIIKLGAEIIYEIALYTIDFANLGVTYESGSGDYAEWLMRSDFNEKIEPGDIIGVYGGKISKSTINADRIMSVSVAPIILGNMPPEGMQHHYEKVAFKGQVPVRVIGTVNKGDYIIPSGSEDGTGIAVAPDLVTVDELIKTVGIAWQASNIPSAKMVKVGVGLNLKNVTTIIEQNSAYDKKLAVELENKDEKLDLLLAEIEKSNLEYEEVNKKLMLLKKVINDFDMIENGRLIKTTLLDSEKNKE